MITRVITTSESNEWHLILNRMTATDIYFTPEYHEVCELNGDGKAMAFVAESDGQTFFYPFMLRPVSQNDDSIGDTQLYDIETVYGYSGPLSSSENKIFITNALEHFHVWCNEQNIVAEFIRFNPLLGNFSCVDSSAYKLEENCQTVVIHLDIEKNALWDSYPSVHRNMIRKAEKNNLVSELINIESGIEKFKSLYKKTMERTRAGAYFFFSDAYFKALMDKLGEQAKLFIVRKGDKVVAGAIFFFINDKVHYHLAGSDPEFRGMAPNNLLLHTVAEYGRENGFSHFHLGGGNTSDPKNPLLKFKASISKNRLSFYTGKRIHMQSNYDALCNDWLIRNGITTKPDYFLLYRKN